MNTRIYSHYKILKLQPTINYKLRKLVITKMQILSQPLKLKYAVIFLLNTKKKTLFTVLSSAKKDKNKHFI